MHKGLLSKLAQVIEQIPKDVLYDFCCSYAESHEELAMALVNEFWRPEKNDYRSMVIMPGDRSCFIGNRSRLLFES